MSDIRTLIDGLRQEIGASPEGLHKVEMACLQAEQANGVGKKFPKWMRPFLRNQNRINVLLIRGLRQLLALHRRHEAVRQREMEVLFRRIDELELKVRREPQP
ncbi:MAG: hypothetical protein PW734_05925 [Verrucomicrobium sp.]|nr:hypothetical protein [Verrucomicrobium sp.]